MAVKKVLCVMNYYPTTSQTYMESELRALEHNYDLRVVSLNPVNLTYKNHLPFTLVSRLSELTKIAGEFAPDVIHGHYINRAPILSYLARLVDAPFTIRAHSFDVLGTNAEKLSKFASMLNDRACLGLLTFPFSRKALRAAGIKHEKIIDCFPVVDYDRFHDESLNGKAVMNTGACIPKKNMGDFLQLASKLPQRDFNLYALESSTLKKPNKHFDDIKKTNTDLGNPVNIVEPVEPWKMPAEYKKHEWLVYTACPKLSTVGWPMAVAEAQASGVGVCVQNVRPDLRDYVGEGGFVFDSIEQVKAIISRPFPQEMRELGFAQAKKSDIREHIKLLEDLWESKAAMRFDFPSLLKPRPSLRALQKKSERYFEHSSRKTAAVH